MQSENRPVIFFDGICNLCNGMVQFLLKHDKRQQCLFASLQSANGIKAIENLQKLDGSFADSLILLYKGHYYAKSDAVLRLAGILGGAWHIFELGYLIPRFIRNVMYDFVARHRYKWFGKSTTCMLPEKRWEDRFLP